MKNNDPSECGISEIISTILILLLAIFLVAIVGAYFLGILQPIEKTGYLVSKAEMFNNSGTNVILLQHSAGDIFRLNATSDTMHYHLLGMTVQANDTISRVSISPLLSQNLFTPGSRVFIYKSGSGYIATDLPLSVPPTGAILSGPLTLMLTDESSHVLLARIVLIPGNTSASISPTPTLTPVPIPVSTVYLNAVKTGSLQPGGVLQFQVTGLWSTVKLDGTTYSVNSSDTVKLVTGSDGSGNLYATSSEIDTFLFDDISLYINGAFKGRGTINTIYINGYSGQTSTLTLKVPGTNAWTDFRVDGTTLINGNNATPVTITGLKGPMNMDSTGSIYYDGAASGYSFT